MESIIYSTKLSNGTELSDLNLSALGLGGMNYGVTVREITSAYQVFANKGVYSGNRTIIKILDSQGNVIIDNSGSSEIVMSEQNADIMTRMLENVVDYGTASKMTLKSKVDVAGKTGTTSSDNDRWFIGYTPYYLGGVWFGYEMPMSLTGFSETKSPALMVWDDVMTILNDKINEKINNGLMEKKSFERASGVISAKVCSKSGLLMTPGCEGHGTVGYFTSSSIPKKYCEIHAQAETTAETTVTPVTEKNPDETTKHVTETTKPGVETSTVIIDESTDTEKPIETSETTSPDSEIVID